MESRYLINSQSFFLKDIEVVLGPSLNITEFFYNTIQGEGHSVGEPAVFLRLSGCTLDCKWCDTDWRLGRKYSFNALFAMMKSHDIFYKFSEGHRLILTGGSPLKQQDALVNFIECITDGQYPLIEVENECVIKPIPELVKAVYQWNNSPKLENSGMKRAARYKPDVIKYMSSLENSWFKFVISCDEDWEEIQRDFLNPGLIKKEQVILMPLAANIDQLRNSDRFVASLAIKYGVRFSSRLQLILNTP